MNVIEAEKEMEGKIVEIGHLAIEAFQSLKEFSTKKIKFSEEAFIVGQEDGHQIVWSYYLDLDFSFLIKGESDDDQPAPDPMATEEQP